MKIAVTMGSNKWNWGTGMWHCARVSECQTVAVKGTAATSRKTTQLNV
jgi:hypothetical protein